VNSDLEIVWNGVDVALFEVLSFYLFGVADVRLSPDSAGGLVTWLWTGRTGFVSRLG
jgi:hypothetical protein